MNDLLTPSRSHRATAVARSALASAWLFGSLALIHGCGDEELPTSSIAPVGPWAPPALRGPVELDDEELAREALGLLGSAAVGADGSCRNCHSLGRPTLSRWSALTAEFDSDCLGDTSLEDAAAVLDMQSCFRQHAERSTSFAPADFGIYSAAAHLPWFEFAFVRASESAADGRARHDDFVAKVGMPRAGAPLTQAEFDVVAEWFARGLPELFELVPEESGEDCTSRISAALSEHIEEMAVSGWRARNEQVPLLMFGCGPGEVGADCLGDLPLSVDEPYAQDWDVRGGDAQIRVLFDNSATPSRFWSRASPDGRYVASGLRDPDDLEYGGQFLDLAEARRIGAAFSYDPTFFPDNSGFLVQRDGGFSSAAPGGGPTSGAADRGDVAVICEQSVLASTPDTLTGEEDQCIALDSEIGLYQQLAKSLDGEDYWVVFGAYDSDNGGQAPVRTNPSAAFGTDSITTLRAMVNRGARFEPGAATRISTPLLGDPMLSPSGRLMVTRVKGREYTTERNGVNVVAAEQSGYALHRVTTTKDGDDWSASLEDVGRICLTGGKATLSYDERWMVFHHYVTEGDAELLGYEDADDPGFRRYLELGASDLYLVDLLDGSAELITDMPPGQYALFPHFRSDGWIYFVVRSLDGQEYLAASDAALLLEDSSSN